MGSAGTCHEYISSWDALEAKLAAEEVGYRMLLTHGLLSLTHFDRLCDTESSCRSQASSAAVSGSLQATGASMDIFSNQV